MLDSEIVDRQAKRVYDKVKSMHQPSLFKSMLSLFGNVMENQAIILRKLEKIESETKGIVVPPFVRKDAP